MLKRQTFKLHGMERGHRHRLNLRSRTRASTPERFSIRKWLDGIKDHEKKLSSSLARAESELKRVKDDLSKEEQYSSRVKQQRDKAEKDVEELRATNETVTQEIARLHGLLDQRTQKLAELEDTFAELKRVKNRDCR